MKIKNISWGFTLIELIVTVAIVAILAVIATPSIRSFVEREKLKTAAISLNSGLEVARSEAIKRNGNVVYTLNDGEWFVKSGDDVIAISETEISFDIEQEIIPSNAYSITFNNLGLTSPNEDGSNTLERINLSLPKTDRKLSIKMTIAGGSRVCDPDSTSNTSSIIGCTDD